MTIAEAKQVRIVDFLARLGHHTQHIKSGQYWYLSPLRNERTPSFKVNDRINEWYDFGEATGGDLVELAKYICRTDCVSEALAYIERLVNGASLPRTRMLTAPPRPVEAEMKDVIVPPIPAYRRGHQPYVLQGGALRTARPSLLRSRIRQYIRRLRGAKRLLQGMPE